jgi:hypothetical protein
MKQPPGPWARLLSSIPLAIVGGWCMKRDVGVLGLVVLVPIPLLWLPNRVTRILGALGAFAIAAILGFILCMAFSGASADPRASAPGYLFALVLAPTLIVMVASVWVVVQEARR